MSDENHFWKALKADANLFRDMAKALDDIADGSSDVVNLVEKLLKENDPDRREKIKKAFLEKDHKIRRKIMLMLHNPHATRSMSLDVRRELNDAVAEIGTFEVRIDKMA